MGKKKTAKKKKKKARRKKNEIILYIFFFFGFILVFFLLDFFHPFLVPLFLRRDAAHLLHPLGSAEPNPAPVVEEEERVDARPHEQVGNGERLPDCAASSTVSDAASRCTRKCAGPRYRRVIHFRRGASLWRASVPLLMSETVFFSLFSFRVLSGFHYFFLKKNAGGGGRGKLFFGPPRRG